jgi:hypothetical protein
VRTEPALLSDFTVRPAVVGLYGPLAPACACWVSAAERAIARAFCVSPARARWWDRHHGEPALLQRKRVRHHRPRGWEDDRRPEPCMARAVISRAPFHARPTANDARPKTVMPMTKTRCSRGRPRAVRRARRFSSARARPCATNGFAPSRVPPLSPPPKGGSWPRCGRPPCRWALRPLGPLLLLALRLAHPAREIRATLGGTDALRTHRRPTRLPLRHIAGLR